MPHHPSIEFIITVSGQVYDGGAYLVADVALGIDPAIPAVVNVRVLGEEVGQLGRLVLHVDVPLLRRGLGVLRDGLAVVANAGLLVNVILPGADQVGTGGRQIAADGTDNGLDRHPLVGLAVGLGLVAASGRTRCGTLRGRLARRGVRLLEGFLEVVVELVPHPIQRDLRHVHVDALLPHVLLLENVDRQTLVQTDGVGVLDHRLARLVAAEGIVVDALLKDNGVGKDGLAIDLGEFIFNDFAWLGR